MSDSPDAVTDKRKLRKVRGTPPAVQRKHEVFVQKYLKHHNATLAAIEAGYSRSHAAQQGSRLVNNEVLQKRIEAYGQLGLDTLAVIATTGKVEVARVQASKELVERAYGKARSNDADNRGKAPNIVISFNKIDTQGNVIEAQGTVISSEVPAVDDSVQASE